MPLESRTLRVCLLLGLVSGCGPVVPPVDGLPMFCTPITDDASVKFSVEPAAIDVCKGRSLIVANVSWDAPQTRDGVRIEIDSKLDLERRVFSAGDRAGSLPTGAWVEPGLCFHMFDHDSGRELARREITAAPCP